MRVTHILALSIAQLALAGCATIVNGSAHTLYIASPDAMSSTITVDGKPSPVHMKEFSRKEVARTSTTVTFEVRSYPAVEFDSQSEFVTLGVDSPSLGHRDAIVHRDLVDGYLLWLYLDNFLTLGVGTLVDVFTGNLFAMPGPIFIGDK